MISKITGQNPEYVRNNTKFCGNEPQVAVPNTADEFISGVNAIAEKERKGGFFSKYFWSPTAIFAGVSLPLIYESQLLIRGRRLKIDGSRHDLKKLFKNFKRNMLLISAAGLGLTQLLQYYFNSNTDKNFALFKQKFDKINTKTSAELDEKTFRSMYKGAYCNSLNGKVAINKNLINDPIFSNRLDGLLRHELVHAKQFEMVARSKDGIKKLNYAPIASTVKRAKQSPQTVKEFEDIYNIAVNDTEGKYDNVTISLSGAEMNFKEYIKAVHILLNNENAGYNDIPVVADMSHYEKIIAEKGALTPEEEEKANQYFDAIINYSDINPLNAFNPFGSYRNNILEKEAYKENQSWLMRIFNR